MKDILRHGLCDEDLESTELHRQVCDEDSERMIALYQEQWLIS